MLCSFPIIGEPFNEKGTLFISCCFETMGLVRTITVSSGSQIEEEFSRTLSNECLGEYTGVIGLDDTPPDEIDNAGELIEFCCRASLSLWVLGTVRWFVGVLLLCTAVRWDTILVKVACDIEFLPHMVVNRDNSSSGVVI